MDTNEHLDIAYHDATRFDAAQKLKQVDKLTKPIDIAEFWSDQTKTSKKLWEQYITIKRLEK